MFIIYDPRNSNDSIQTVDDKCIKLLKLKWDEIQEEPDILRYKINNLNERIENGYLLQLNPERKINRRQPEHIDNICQPFDPKKFNFTKASPKETLFLFWKKEDDTNKHTIIVNVSPITRYHSLLCPSIQQCLPQIITADSIELVLQFMFLANDRDLRIGFNSLCALASVNHLHYHLFLESNTLPVEGAQCIHIKGPLYCITNYPAPAFCFEIDPNSVPQTSKDVYTLVKYLLEHSIAHNLFVTRGLKVQSSANVKDEVIRCLLWPRKSSSGAKQMAAFNVALCELSGWFPVYSKEHYETLKAEDLENELSKWNIDNFQNLCEELKRVF